jgi:hypothetical protein
LILEKKILQQRWKIPFAKGLLGIALCFFSQSSFAFADFESPLFSSEQSDSRLPQSTRDQMIHEEHQEHAQIMAILDSEQFLARTENSGFEVGELVPVFSQDRHSRPVAFVRITQVQKEQDGTYALMGRLQSSVDKAFVRPGDSLVRLNLSTSNENYPGRVELLQLKPAPHVSSKYRPLFSQSASVGGTAQTLANDESHFQLFGNYSYGWSDQLSLQVTPLGIPFGIYAAGFRYKIYQSESQTVSVEPSVTYFREYESGVSRLDIFWDTAATGHQITHTVLRLATIPFSKDNKQKVVLILGSSIQTGYEFILSNWDRLLLGPRYNLDARSVGGYIAYHFIWDRFHLNVGLNATDLGATNYTTNTDKPGYYLSFDMMWRY